MLWGDDGVIGCERVWGCMYGRRLVSTHTQHRRAHTDRRPNTHRTQAHTYLLLPADVPRVRVELRALVGHGEGVGTRERRLVEDALLFHCTVVCLVGPVCGGPGVMGGVVVFLIIYDTTYAGIVIYLFVCLFVFGFFLPRRAP